MIHDSDCECAIKGQFCFHFKELAKHWFEVIGNEVLPVVLHLLPHLDTHIGVRLTVGKNT